jgi:uncharacterized membrane-anchored protein YitT (DUF2179 family)
MRQFVKNSPPALTWHSIRDYLLIGLGAIVQALALVIFLVPAQLVTGGVSGLAQIINAYTGWPIGLMVFLGNMPLFLLGWRYLGGRRFALRTAFAIVTFSAFTDGLTFILPGTPLTEDIFLNTLYGGVISGIGFGLVYLGQGTSGGSDILARILNHWRNFTISQSYLLTDTLPVLLAGFTFGWTNALYALVMIYISGIAAEGAMGGSNITRTATIITNHPKDVAEQILRVMKRGVTMLSGKGAYTGTEREILYCVISRSEVNQLKALVKEVDPAAFMVIGQAQEALGEGFQPLK